MLACHLRAQISFADGSSTQQHGTGPLTNAVSWGTARRVVKVGALDVLMLACLCLYLRSL